MESLHSILGGQPQKRRPEEHVRVQEYIKRELSIDTKLVSSRDAITILVSHGAAAAMVRLKLHDIQKECNVSKQLWVRIDGSVHP